MKKEVFFCTSFLNFLKNIFGKSAKVDRVLHLIYIEWFARVIPAKWKSTKGETNAGKSV